MTNANAHPRAHVRGPQIPAVGPARIEILIEHLDIDETPLDDQNDTELEENTSVAIPISRREQRKRRKHADTSPSPDPITDISPSSTPKPPKKSKPSIPPTLIPMPPTGSFYPLLVASLGNPGPTYTNTLHSAGHTVLSILQVRGLYTPFSKGLSGLVSRPNTTRYRLSLTGGFQKDADRGLVEGEDDFVLWQSTGYMNVSGTSVRKAWSAFERECKGRGMEGRLVVVHDELESPLGAVKVKDGAASPRGHNGLKSCQGNLGGVKWWRVGVGIGRPESRDASVVSKYVLSKMDRREQAAIEGAAYPVLEALREIQEGKR